MLPRQARRRTHTQLRKKKGRSSAIQRIHSRQRQPLPPHRQYRQPNSKPKIRYHQTTTNSNKRTTKTPNLRPPTQQKPTQNTKINLTLLEHHEPAQTDDIRSIGSLNSTSVAQLCQRRCTRTLGTLNEFGLTVFNGANANGDALIGTVFNRSITTIKANQPIAAKLSCCIRPGNILNVCSSQNFRANRTNSQVLTTLRSVISATHGTSTTRRVRTT